MTKRHQRRITQNVRSNPQVVDFIVKKKIKSDDALFVFDFLQKYSEYADKVKKYCEEIMNNYQIDRKRALNAYVSANMTRNQCNIIRNISGIRVLQFGLVIIKSNSQRNVFLRRILLSFQT